MALVQVSSRDFTLHHLQSEIEKLYEEEMVEDEEEASQRPDRQFVSAAAVETKYGHLLKAFKHEIMQFPNALCDICKAFVSKE